MEAALETRIDRGAQSKMAGFDRYSECLSLHRLDGPLLLAMTR
jgi:hypothetical protein